MYNFDTPVNRRGTDCVKWDETAADVLPMWIADMDFETAPCVIEALRRRVEHGVFGYNLIPDTFYDRIIWWQQHRHGWTPRREWMLYTSGVVPALSAIIKGLCAEGSSVATFTPAYNCFFSSIRNNGCQLVENPLVWLRDEERYEIDFDALERCLARPDVTLFLLCNPHNPTGRVWTAVELHRLAELCARHEVTVLADEIHCEFIHPGLGRAFLPFAPIAGQAGCKWVVANAPNKAFNIAGLQTAYIITPSADFRQRIDRAININEVCDINCFSFVALQAAYTPEGEEWLQQLNAYIYENYSLFRSQLKAACPTIPVAHLEGTYLPWVDVTSLGISSEALSRRLLKEEHLWLNPGEMYGQPGFLRVNLATQRAHVLECLHRLLPVLSKTA